ncbi:MAG TPA: helix-turn-helix transcriptional regulator [Sporosarcina sp.]|nr:helix-turn-helix transcriptional regulator [Sporosarcina sp.]
MSNVRVWLKERRQKANFTQDEIASLTGISRSYYTHIEQGTKTPSVPVAKKLADALSFKWVLFFEDEIEEP